MIRMKFSDNVLDFDCHTEVELSVSNDKVKSINIINRGVYGIDFLIGKTVSELAKMTCHDPTGYHPETYCEIWDNKRNQWRMFWESSEL